MWWYLLHEGVQVFCHFKPHCIAQKGKSVRMRLQQTRRWLPAGDKSAVDSVGLAETQPFIYERGRSQPLVS